MLQYCDVVRLYARAASSLAMSVVTTLESTAVSCVVIPKTRYGVWASIFSATARFSLSDGIVDAANMRPYQRFEASQSATVACTGLSAAYPPTSPWESAEVVFMTAERSVYVALGAVAKPTEDAARPPRSVAADTDG